MALWMDAGAQPKTASEQADIDAISAIKESAAIELKEKGNQYVKMGKKHYSDAIECYTRAIQQKILSDMETSILYSNRAHVNLLLGNYRRALTDAEDAIRLCATNVKAYYRAAKAASSLGLLPEASSFCQSGLEEFPTSEDLKRLSKQIDLKQIEDNNHKAQVSKAVDAAQALVRAFESRDLNIGKPVYQELTGIRKPLLDDNVLHWPVLFLYAEVMSTDFIEAFPETDAFSAHLDMMYSEGSPLPWDHACAYTREAIELYYQVDSGSKLPRKEILRHMLEGTTGALSETNEDDIVNHRNPSEGHVKWNKVNERRTLHDVLKEDNYIIPGIPVFYVVSKRSPFYKEFKLGKWTPP